MGLTRSLLLKLLIVSAELAATAILLLLLGGRGGGCDTPIPVSLGISSPTADSTDLDAALREMIAKGWIYPGVRSLSIGLDLRLRATAMRRLGFPFVTSAAATACCWIPYGDASFDFVFSAALDRARVPARVVLEMERVLRPGCVGAVIRRRSGIMRAAAPVAALLRFSDVVGALPVNGSALVVFRKRVNHHSAASPSSSGCGECGFRLSQLLSLTEFVRGTLMSI